MLFCIPWCIMVSIMVNGLHLYIYIYIGCHARALLARQEQLGVRCLAHFDTDTPRVGSNRQPSDCQTTALTSWAISPINVWLFVLRSPLTSLALLRPLSLTRHFCPQNCCSLDMFCLFHHSLHTLEQWFPNGVPRHTGVPWEESRCAVGLRQLLLNYITMHTFINKC